MISGEDAWTEGDPFAGTLRVKGGAGAEESIPAEFIEVDDPLSRLIPTKEGQSDETGPLIVEHKKRSERKRKFVKSSAADKAHKKSKPVKEKEVTMGNALHDIRKMNLNSVTGKDKVLARAELVVNLGAKRPKNKCVNYKDLKQSKKDETERKLEQKKLDILQNNSVNKKNRSGRNK